MLSGGSLAVYTALLACLLLIACSKQNQQQVKRYPLKGVVTSVDKGQGQLVVDAGEIPGFMPAMTMPYPVADPRVLEHVAPGDQISADVVVGDGAYKLENILPVKTGAPAASSPSVPPEPSRQSTQVPDFTFVNQDGKPIHLDQFRGKSVLLTFIYTRCPLPDYCPLMTRNFADIEKQLAKDPHAYERTHLLTLSFDPEHDTPEVLRSYGLAYVPSPTKAPFAHWDFASIPQNEMSAVTSFFDVAVLRSDGQITHSLSTAIISPGGKLYKWYDGNEWKPAQVMAALLDSLRAPS